MPGHFDISFQRMDGDQFNLTLLAGEVLFVLGANGTGKSSLVGRLFAAHNQHAKRISAHRQTWFTSNTLDMTPNSRNDMETNIRGYDQQERSRYVQEYASQRTGVAIFDLIDSDTMLSREIADLVRSSRLDEAQKRARTPAPLSVINQLMRLSNIPIDITIEERQKIVARRNGGGRRIVWPNSRMASETRFSSRPTS